MKTYHFGGTTKVVVGQLGSRRIHDGHGVWRRLTNSENALFDYAMTVQAWVPTLLENLTRENTGFLRVFRRWQISDEPLRNDAAAVLDAITIKHE